MASLYKKPIIIRDPTTGQKVKAKSKKWWGRFKDENGLEKRVPLATDRNAAQVMLSELVKKMERRSAGLEDPFETHRKRPLSHHVKDFANYLRNKGNTEAYAVQTKQRLISTITTCRFSKITDISASRVQSHLGDLRQKGLGIASCNHYLRAFKMFNRWLVRDRRTGENVVAHLSTMNAETDRRRLRRPLSPEEFAWLLTATRGARPIQGIPGEERVLLYILACYTGFRRNEIHSLTRQSFDFDSDPPTITVQAAYSKRRRIDVLALRKDLAAYIEQSIRAKPGLGPEEPLVAVRGKRTAEMLRKDLKRARELWIKKSPTAAERVRREKSSFLEYRDQSGCVADFHALRKTFITNLCRAGVSPKAAQVLARHSDINLTMNVYTMLGVHDQASAVEALPPIPGCNGSRPVVSPGKRAASGRLGRPGRHQKVPRVVPRGAEYGAVQPALGALRIAPDCTEEPPQRRKRTG